MPSGTRGRAREPFAAALDLPPPFRPVTLREAGDAFAHAVTIAAEAGAGTLVNVGRFDLAEFAVVLEPEEPLRTARRAVYAGMAALADALAVHAPPEKPIAFDWPDAVRVDGGLVGGGRLAWPADAAEDETPDWLVFGAMIRTVAMGEAEPGLRPLGSALEEEGFDDLGSGRLVESFARHLMVGIDEELLGAACARAGAAPRPRGERRSHCASCDGIGTRAALARRRAHDAVLARPGDARPAAVTLTPP